LFVSPPWFLIRATSVARLSSVGFGVQKIGTRLLATAEGERQKKKKEEISRKEGKMRERERNEMERTTRDSNGMGEIHS